jgi:hypothetical protein
MASQQRSGWPLSALADFIDYLSRGGRDSVGRQSLNPVDDCELAAQAMFRAIEKHLGRDEAYRIFSKFGTPPSAEKRRLIKNLMLLDRYDTMKPKPNVQRLAWQLAVENKILPQEERWGPRGTTNPMTLDKHIRRLLAERSNHQS